MPTVRVLLTKENTPFLELARQFAPAGLSSSIDVWNSVSDPGWKLSFRERPRARRNMVIAAARRKDAAQSPGAGESGDSTWYLTQIFADNQSALIARWAVTCLLSLYADRLAVLRDRAGRQRRISRSVREAKELERFLIRDGLDTSTIIAELEDFTATSGAFRFGVAEYSEDISTYPEAWKVGRETAELIPALRELIKTQSSKLKRDTEAATVNIIASSELRQSIANTVLQRRVLILTIVSIVIALASLYISIASLHASSNGGSGSPIHGSSTSPSRHAHS